MSKYKLDSDEVGKSLEFFFSFMLLFETLDVTSALQVKRITYTNRTRFLLFIYVVLDAFCLI